MRLGFMKEIRAQQLAEGKLPVFVFPANLVFCCDDQASHKQVLTLYNPYEFVLHFKVLCNNPAKYTVVESEGFIKPRCCVDIVVRTSFIEGTASPSEDKFRIQVYEHGIPKLLGKRDVTSSVLLTKKEKPKIRKYSHTLQEVPRFSPGHAGTVTVQRSLPSIPVIVLSVACISALMLPTQGTKENDSSLPDYLYLSVNQKLVAAYVLGLITMAILKT